MLNRNNLNNSSISLHDCSLSSKPNNNIVSDRDESSFNKEDEYASNIDNENCEGKNLSDTNDDSESGIESDIRSDNESDIGSDNESDIGSDNESEIKSIIHDFLDKRRCVNPSFFFEEMQDLEHEHKLCKLNPNNNFDCGFDNLKIIKYRDNKMVCFLTIQCSVCFFKSEIKTDREDPRAFTLSESIVAGAIFSGNGKYNIEENFAAANIPFLKNQRFIECREKILKCLETANNVEIRKAVDEEKRLAAELGDIHRGYHMIPVTTDGSWLMRIYKGSGGSANMHSLCGMAVVIGYRTKKVLAFDERNKYCYRCSVNACDGQKCFRNWDPNASSTSMEANIIEALFKKSIQDYGIIYKTLIADGDSSVHNKVQYVYADLGIEVNKIECVNHLFRNIGIHYEKISNYDLSTEFKNRMWGSVVKFRNFVKSRALVFRRTVTNLTRIVNEDNTLTWPERVATLQRQILHVTDHVFGRHDACNDAGIPCEGLKEGETDIIPDLQENGMYVPLKNLAIKLSANSNSVIFQLTNNPAESFMNIVAKTNSSKRINSRVW